MYYLAISPWRRTSDPGPGSDIRRLRFASSPKYRVNGEWHALRAFLTSAYRTAAIAGAALIVVTGVVIFVLADGNLRAEALPCARGPSRRLHSPFIRLNGAIANALSALFPELPSGIFSYGRR